MNSVKKQKTALTIITIIMIVAAIGLLVGGIVLLISGATGLSDKNNGGAIAKLVFGIIMAIISIPLGIAGFRFFFVSMAVKATNGTIAQDNSLAMKKNNKVCPKCGATNTPNVDTCQSCGEKLD